MPAIRPGSAISNPRASAVDADEGANLSPDRPGPGGGPRRRAEARGPRAGHRRLVEGRREPAGDRSRRAETQTPSCRSQVRMKKAEHIAADFEPFDARFAPGGSRAGGRPQPRPSGAAARHGRCHRHRRRRPGPGRGRQRRLLPARALAVRRTARSPTSSGPIAAPRSSCRDCSPTWASPAPRRSWPASRPPSRPRPRNGAGSTGLYLDQPEEWDDPYRFFRW